LSEASLRPTPRGASSAGHPEGARPLARLSFAYFSLAKQRKVRPAAGQIYAQKNLFFGYFLLAKQKKVTRPTGRNLYQEPHFRSKK
jgi:hypothetical protein